MENIIYETREGVVVKIITIPSENIQDEINGLEATKKNILAGDTPPENEGLVNDIVANIDTQLAFLNNQNQ
jgi:hypothetical protein